MHRIVFALFVVLLAFPALAQEREKKKDDRWKITVNGSVRGPGSVYVDIERYNSCYRCDHDATTWMGNFADEYLVPNGARRYGMQPGPTRRSHWESTNTSSFYRRWTGFRGQVGDEYLLGYSTHISDVREQGNALGLALDYRVKGPVWLTYSFSLSREMIIDQNQHVDFLRVEDVRQRVTGHLGRIDHGRTEVDTSRHGIDRSSTQEHRFYSHAFLVKFDLASGNDFWSVLPQAGVELMTERRSTTIHTTRRRYLDFARRPNSSHQRTSSSTHSETNWEEIVRPMVGLTLELYPGGKGGYVGIVVDGRYRFNYADDWRRHKQGGSPTAFVVPYEYSSGPSEWSILVGGVVRF